MKLFLFFIFYFSNLVLLIAEQDLLHVGYRAEALFAAKDYAAADQIYQNLFQLPLPDWQKSRIQYNLGTIRLAQQKWDEALQEFRKISIHTLSSPYLLLNLLTNLALAEWQQAESLTTAEDLDWAIYLLERSLYDLNQARDFACKIQEAAEELTPCQALRQLHVLKEQLILRLRQAQQKQRDQLIKQAPGQVVISVLKEGLEHFLLSLKFLSSQTKELKAENFTYLFNLGETFNPLWEQMQQQEMDASQKQAFTEAQKSYTEALQALKEEQFSQAVKALKQSIEALTELSTADSFATQLNLLVLHSQLLLTTEVLSSYQLQALLERQKKITPSKENAEILKQSTLTLNQAITSLKEEQYPFARFYLAVSTFLLQQLVVSHKTLSTAEKILEQALKEARQALQLSRLANLAQANTNQEILYWIDYFQKQTLKIAEPFISHVLDEEKELYQNISQPVTRSRCQRKPWDQVIPLFEQGEQMAKQLQSLLKMPLDLSTLSFQQEQMVMKWQLALNLLRQAPQEQTENTSAEQQSTAPREADIQEVFQTLQEMELEDRPQQQIPLQPELNTTW